MRHITPRGQVLYPLGASGARIYSLVSACSYLSLTVRSLVIFSKWMELIISTTVLNKLSSALNEEKIVIAMVAVHTIVRKNK